MNKLNIIRTLNNLQDNGSTLYTNAILKRCAEENIEVEIYEIDNQVELNFICGLQTPYIVMQPCEFIVPNTPFNMETHLTAEVICDMCKEIRKETHWKLNVLVVNRSKLIGRPLGNMLLDNDFTIMIAHSQTDKFDLDSMIKASDVVVLATGKDMSKLDLSCTSVIDISNDYKLGNKQYIKQYLDRKETGTRTIDKLISKIKNIKVGL
jgi:5,10-methylene-tetrahydrofolate dehydrogenase/methenyl tetrahydrofolate cyclohydrolase